ncbi:DsbA family protein [Halomicrococcus sp. SG-WS-1]|uniref:DsbA family protein n=1 Tax=Halomicrococcus sp. SG-WS-1 TaxID=3439057 RepID=UPI003F7A5607
MSNSDSSRRKFLKATGAVAAIGLGSTTAASAASVGGAPVPDDTDSLTYATMGTDADNPTATLFGNFKCPYTQEFVQENLDDVIEEYVAAGDLNLRYRAHAYERPGHTSHGSSYYYISDSDPLVSEAALGAWNVSPDDYWAFFRDMFDEKVSGTVTYDEMADRMRATGVDDVSEAIDRAAAGRYEDDVKATIGAADDADVDFTPTLELGGETTSPHHDVDDLLSWIDGHLDGASASTSSQPTTRAVTLDGRSTSGWTHYELSASSGIEKSKAMNASIESDDVVSGATAEGWVGPWKDSYVVEGDITNFSAPDSLRVYVDGETVDPSTLG